MGKVSPGDKVIYITGGKGDARLECEVSMDDCDEDVALANAHLIAKAPELLKACKQWLAAHDENMHLLTQGVVSPTDLKQACHDGIQAVRAAIAKAEGVKG